MIWLIVLTCILAFTALIAVQRLGVHVNYSEGKLKLWAKASIVKLLLVGGKKKSSEKSSDKPRKQKKPKKKHDESKKKKEKQADGPNALEKLQAYFDCAREAASRLDRRFRIDALTVHFCAAGDDPFNAAVIYGATCAAAGNIIPQLEKHFRICQYDIHTDVCFTQDKPYIYVDAVLTLAVWEIFYIAFGVLKKLPRKRRAHKVKGAQNHGKEAHQ